MIRRLTAICTRPCVRKPHSVKEDSVRNSPWIRTLNGSEPSSESKKSVTPRWAILSPIIRISMRISHSRGERFIFNHLNICSNRNSSLPCKRKLICK